MKMLAIGIAALAGTLGAASEAAHAFDVNAPHRPYAATRHAQGWRAPPPRHRYHYGVHGPYRWARRAHEPGHAAEARDPDACCRAAPQWADVGLPEYMTGDYSNYF